MHHVWETTSIWVYLSIETICVSWNIFKLSLQTALVDIKRLLWTSIWRTQSQYHWEKKWARDCLTVVDDLCGKKNLWQQHIINLLVFFCSIVHSWTPNSKHNMYSILNPPTPLTLPHLAQPNPSLPHSSHPPSYNPWPNPPPPPHALAVYVYLTMPRYM